MPEQRKWLESLRRALASAQTANLDRASRLAQFKRICEQVETDLAGAGPTAGLDEWVATKMVMKTIYRTTRQAHKYGYTFYEYAIEPHVEDRGVVEMMKLPVVQQAVNLWGHALGWKAASIVNWTSVLKAMAQSGARPFPHHRSEHAVRLEGLRRPAPRTGLRFMRPVEGLAGGTRMRMSSSGLD